MHPRKQKESIFHIDAVLSGYFKEAGDIAPELA
jgi:hypothetical protein